MLSSENVKHIAELARLQLTLEEIEKIGADLSTIVRYVEKLNEVDTENIHPMNGGTDLLNRMRKDSETPDSKILCNPEESALLMNAAPAKERGYVKVKSVF